MTKTKTKRLSKPARGKGDGTTIALTGHYSGEIPIRLLGAYQASLENPELTRLENEIALIDMRVAQLMQEVKEDGDGAGDWRKAVTSFREARRCFVKRDLQMMDIAMNRLEGILEAKADRSKQWREIRDLISLRSKLCETETKIQERMRVLIKTSEAEKVVKAVVESVKTELQAHPDILDRIWTRLRNIARENGAEFHPEDVETRRLTP